MSPEFSYVIKRVVKDCKVCQKFAKSVSQPSMTLPKASLFNEIHLNGRESFWIEVCVIDNEYL